MITDSTPRDCGRPGHSKSVCSSATHSSGLKECSFIADRRGRQDVRNRRTREGNAAEHPFGTMARIHRSDLSVKLRNSLLQELSWASTTRCALARSPQATRCPAAQTLGKGAETQWHRRLLRCCAARGKTPPAPAQHRQRVKAAETNPLGGSEEGRAAPA